MYSSTRIPAGYRSSARATFSSSSATVSATESWVMPLLLPSKFGLTMTGKRSAEAFSSSSFSMYCHPGVRTSWSRRMSLVSCLSSVTARA